MVEPKLEPRASSSRVHALISVLIVLQQIKESVRTLSMGEEDKAGLGKKTGYIVTF